jgi:hypothetical protein
VSAIPADAVAGRKPKFLDQMRTFMRARRYSRRTEQVCRLARKASGHALKIATAFRCTTSMFFVREKMVASTLATPRIFERDLMNTRRASAFATSYRGPWKLIYYEAYLEREDALGRERYLKSGSGRKFLKTQLRYYLDKNPFAA